MSIEQKLDTIEDNVAKVYSAGIEDGKQEGYQGGFEAGQKSEWNKFWDVLQCNGTRTNYNYAFYSAGNNQSGWNDDNFKPKYDLNIAHAQYTFQNSRITNLKQILINCGVSLNITSTQMYYTFYISDVTHLPEIGSTKCTNAQNCFNNCINLVSIDKLILSNTADCAIQNAFMSCSSLAEIRFSENISPVGLSLSACNNLSHDSILNLLNALAVKSGSTYSVTLGSTNLAKLTDAEKAIATQKGWTLA